MSDADETQENPDQVVRRTEYSVKLCRFLWERFCAHSEVPVAQAIDIPIGKFCEWLRELTATTNSEEIGQWTTALDIPVESWDTLLEILEHPLRFVNFAMLWEQVTLGHRSTPKYPVHSVHGVVLIRWEDGRITPVSNYMPRELINEPGEFKDGDVCTFMRIMGPRLVELVAQGTDAIHDQQSYLISEDTVRLMLEHVLGLANQLSAQQAGEMKALANIMYSYLSPPIPHPMARQIVEDKRAARKAQEVPVPPAPPASQSPLILGGGWEE